MRFVNQIAAKADENCRSALHEVRNHLQTISSTSSLHKHLTEYSLIVCSGTLEQAFKNIIADHVTRGSSPEIVQYIDKTIRRCGANPSKSKIVEMLEKFNSAWGRQFKQETSRLSQRDIDSLESLVKERNLLAHGDSVSISLNCVIEYYCRARNVVGKLESFL